MKKTENKIEIEAGVEVDNTEVTTTEALTQTETETETETDVPTHKVQFISTLVSPNFKYFTGDVTELNEEDYQLALKYRSIKDL